MKILIINNGYPSEKNLYGDVFVHVRVKEYQRFHECLIISLEAKEDFVYEGVPVKACKDTKEANEIIRQYNPDVILIHFVLKIFIEEIIPLYKVPVIIWIHGYEALGWYRRLFNYTWRNYLPHNLLSMARSNRQQLKSLASLIRKSNTGSNIFFVFVSSWMRKICEADTSVKVKYARIIPNPINVNLFNYSPKNAEKRKRILLIRPFSSKKYATDIATNAIWKLSGSASFKDFHITIIGKGPNFKKYTDRFKKFNNVSLIENFLTQTEIKRYHDDHGIFLCPTRQDAQGVSMCEAMSSGLVPVTSFNTAIPEFVEDGKAGFLTSSVSEIADKVIFLYNHPERFSEMSAYAASSIKTKCAIENIVNQELELIESQVQSV